MTILVDMDDTMECLIEPWVQCLNENHGLNVDVDDIKEWNMKKTFPTLTSEQIYLPLNTKGFWKKVKPKDGAVEYLKKLICDGHNIIVVTATYFESIADKIKDVLFEYFPFIPYEDVIIASRKQLIIGDILIDDAPHNLLGGVYKPILFDAPHNRNFNSEKLGITRVHNWEEVYTLVKEISNSETKLRLKDEENI